MRVFKLYMISYDLRVQGRDYKAVGEAIQRLAKNFTRPLQSVWVVRSQFSATAIRDELKKHVDSNDGILVLSIDRDWATYNPAQNSAEWLKGQLV
jgi:hypothetical protein